MIGPTKKDCISSPYTLLIFTLPILLCSVYCSYVKFKTKQTRLRSDEKVIAQTTYGKVKGVKWRSVYGRCEYFSFEGIPFAKPPVGELRFKAPVEPEPWSGIKRCTHVRSKPCQYNIIIKQCQGQEDCLYLNVYTKQVSKKPVAMKEWRVDLTEPHAREF